MKYASQLFAYTQGAAVRFLDAVGYYGHWVDIGEKLASGARDGWSRAALPPGLVGRSVFRVEQGSWVELGEILHVQDLGASVGIGVVFVHRDGCIGKVSLADRDIRVDNDGLRAVRAMREDT